MLLILAPGAHTVEGRQTEAEDPSLLSGVFMFPPLVGLKPFASKRQIRGIWKFICCNIVLVDLCSVPFAAVIGEGR